MLNAFLINWLHLKIQMKQNHTSPQNIFSPQSLYPPIRCANFDKHNNADIQLADKFLQAHINMSLSWSRSDEGPYPSYSYYSLLKERRLIHLQTIDSQQDSIEYVYTALQSSLHLQLTKPSQLARCLQPQAQTWACMNPQHSQHDLYFS